MNDPFRSRLIALTTGLGITMCLVGSAQGPGFEVVSIKRNTSGQGVGGGIEGDRYTANQQNAFGLVIGAFGTDRILNLPAWGTDERYDIVAKAPATIASGQLPSLLLNLLRDRFAFRGRLEKRDLPVYRLTTIRDGGLGPRLRRSTTDCGRASCGGGARSGKLAFVGMTLNAVTTALAGPAGRPVLNETGLAGRFDVDLDWSPSLDAPDNVSIFTAVQEQLGLRLVSSTAPLDVVIVEHIERPTPN